MIENLSGPSGLYASQRGGRRLHRLCVTSGLVSCLLMGSAPPSAATSCPAGEAGVGVACDATTFTDEEMLRLLDADSVEVPAPAGAASTPAANRGLQTPGSSASATPPASTLPVVVTPGAETETSAHFKSSLGQWGAYATARAQQKAEAAKAMAPMGLMLPKPVAPAATPLDVWTSLDLDGIDRNTAAARKQRVGADLKLLPGTTIGLSAGRAEATASSASDSAERSRDTTIATTLRSDFAGPAGVRVAPAISLTRGRETMHDAAGASHEATQAVAVEPRVSRTFELDEGGTLEPFVVLRNTYSLGEETGDVGSARAAGAGLVLKERDGASLSVGADVEHGRADTPANVTSRVRLNVPLQ
ncbi:MAG: hypothetical protein NW205_02055 [Hyphomicrobiaceae bacterium]|nr:hypothetical protein [Hyphomicrobiaceae bacterium]